jgi:hypothetical protein
VDTASPPPAGSLAAQRQSDQHAQGDRQQNGDRRRRQLLSCARVMALRPALWRRAGVCNCLRCVASWALHRFPLRGEREAEAAGPEQQPAAAAGDSDASGHQLPLAHPAPAGFAVGQWQRQLAGADAGDGEPGQPRPRPGRRSREYQWHRQLGPSSADGLP